MFRRYSGGDDGTLAPTPAVAGAASSNPLSAPSAAAMAVDKALGSLERMDQSVRDLSPVGRLNIFGAGLLSAKLRMEAATDGKKKRKRGKSSDLTY
jgi:hypothetical protein